MAQQNPYDQFDGPVFVPAPGAAVKEQREVRGEVREEEKLDISRTDESRKGREELRGSARELREKFEAQKPVQDYQIALPAFATMMDLVSRTPSKANDFMLITQFNKVQDPGSAVLQGEREGAQDVDTLAAKFATQLQGKFDPETGFVSQDARRQFIEATHALIAERRRAYDAMRTRYATIAQQPEYNVRPELVTGADFGDTFRSDIADRWQKIFPEPPKGDAALQVAEGATFSTDEDIAEAKARTEAWRNGATIEQIQGMMRPGESLTPADIERLKADTNRALPFGPASSGKREAGAQIGTGIGGSLASTAAGAVSGYSANMAEEIAGLIPGVDPEQVKAAFRAYESANPGMFLGGEIAGGIYSPVNKIAPGAGMGRVAAQGAAYGGIYGAGEETPGASLTEQVIGPQTGMAGRGIRALEGMGLGAVGGVIGGKLAERFLPNPVAEALPTVTANMDNIAQGGLPPITPPPATGGVVQSLPTPSPSIAAPVVRQADVALPPEELGNLITVASGTGRKADVARIKLAEMASVNEEALAASKRLGIEVPADVFSDNPQIKEAIGLTRAVQSSDASAAWRTSVAEAVDQADSVMRDFDAAFIEGAVAPGAVSQRVRDSLGGTRASLARQAKDMYAKVDEAIPKETPVQMDNLFSALTDIAGEVGEGGMSAAEKGLMRLIRSGEAGEAADITYGRLIREKNLIGKAIARQESPFGSLDEATLKRLYAALAQDQLDNVGTIAGTETRDMLRAANFTYAKERALGKRMVQMFGQDLEGGIATKMRGAISEAAKGDPGQFTRLFRTIPEDLRRETVATSLASLTRSTRGAEKGGFGFSEYADLYPKLRANPQVYKGIVDALGGDADKVLRDLFVVSKRITEARANVPTTGKANQALLMGMKAEGLVRRIMTSSAGQRTATAAIGFIPGGGAVAPDIINFLAARPSATEAAGKMFSSPEFQELIVNVSTKQNVPEKLWGRVATSPAFSKFANVIGLPRDAQARREWLRKAAVAGVAQTKPDDATPSSAITPQIGAQ